MEEKLMYFTSMTDKQVYTDISPETVEYLEMLKKKHKQKRFNGITGLCVEFREDGSLSMTAWILVAVLTFSCLGFLLAIGKVLLLEQSNSGLTAFFQECVIWDDSCANSCQESITQWAQPTNNCEGCCLQYKTKTVPLGKRIFDLGKIYAIWGAGIGVTVGVIYSEHRRQRGGV